MTEKEAAARRALGLVRKGMTLGLGTGSTAAIFIRLLGKRNKAEKLGLRCIATSVESERIARKAGLRVTEFGRAGDIDLAVDGADVVVGNLLIKGLGGGAIAREKVVDYRAKQFVVIVDSSKVKNVFGGSVPVEVLPFASETVKGELEEIGAASVGYRKKGGKKFVTDNGNYILDAFFREIREPRGMETGLNMLPGVIENGIFTRSCKVIVGRS